MSNFNGKLKFAENLQSKFPANIPIMHQEIVFTEDHFKCNEQPSFPTQENQEEDPLAIKTEAMHVNQFLECDLQDYECNICNQNFESLFTLREHYKIHTNDNRLKCYYCSATFLCKEIFLSHLSSHLNYNECKCDICNIKFDNLSLLENHVFNNHELIPQEEKFTCNLCGINFKSLKLVNQHTV